MALGAKLKLGFIDGSTPELEAGSVDHQRWLRCDYMVRCWILNSMTGNLSKGFMYCNSVKQLWNEIVERYGQMNGPMLYQLKRNLANQSQENLSIHEYFGNLKKVWDEVQSLEPLPKYTCGRCSCDLTKRVADLESRNQLMQFLLGLNDGYEGVKNQVLTTDPLPPVNKAFYLAQQIESKNSFTGNHNGMQESSALSAAKSQYTADGKKDYKKMKSDKKCSHYNYKGHTIEQCFKIIGYPDWFKDRKKTGGKAMANMTEAADSPLDGDTSTNGKSVDNSLVTVVYQEMLKLMKGKGSAEPSFGSFAGP